MATGGIRTTNATTSWGRNSSKRTSLPARLVQATVSKTKPRLFTSIDAVDKSDNAGTSQRTPTRRPLLFQPLRPRGEPVWVYDVPRIRHGNQAVRSVESRLGSVPCQLVENSIAYSRRQIALDISCVHVSTALRQQRYCHGLICRARLTGCFGPGDRSMAKSIGPLKDGLLPVKILR